MWPRMPGARCSDEGGGLCNLSHGGKKMGVDADRKSGRSEA